METGEKQGEIRMPYDLWEKTMGGADFVESYRSLSDAITAGDIMHKKFDGEPRAAAYIEWLDDERVDHMLMKRSKNKSWETK